MIKDADIHLAKILIVDDQEANVQVLTRMLQADGYVSIASTQDPHAVCELHRQQRYDLILLDLVMPGLSGFQVMEALKKVEADDYLPVVVITAEPEHKLRALQAGARDFVSKPLDLGEILLRVHNMLEVRLLHLETRRLYDQILEEKDAQRRLEVALEEALATVARGFADPMGLVAKSPVMEKLVNLTRRVAKVDSTVLIVGESGSGKERIARLLHRESTRAQGPFIAVNCGAITETLLESELFGHSRGAFSGATQDRPGLFEAAQKGTLLLDEIGDITPGMQVKLLRVLQEREIRRVGENKNRTVDVRIVAATNRDLGQAVKDGTFRQDLYFRLNVVDLHVPALRERREDILLLAHIMLAKAAKQMNRKVTSISREAADQLLRYGWPGNVRELENVLERAVALSLAPASRVELEDLPEEVRQVSPRQAAMEGEVLPLEAVEKNHILAILELNHGNQTRTSEQLCIGSATLYRKLKSYGLIDGKGPAKKGEAVEDLL